MPEPEAEEAPPSATPPGRTWACSYCGKEFRAYNSMWKHRVRCRLREATGQASPPEDQAKEGEKPTTRKERKPTVPAPSKRHSCAHLLAPLWGQLARLAPSLPAQRAMAWQAPGAGQVLDQALAGTTVDRWVLQKVVGQESKYRPALDLLSLPVMLAVAERNPSMLPVLLPALRSLVRSNLDAVLSAKAVKKAEDSKLRAKAEAAGLEWEAQVIDEQGNVVTVDLPDQIVAALLSGPEEPATIGGAA